MFCQKLSRKAVYGAYIGLKPHPFPLRAPCSERFKFPSLDKRKGAPVYSVKNFRVGQFSGPTRGALKPHSSPRSPPRSEPFKFSTEKPAYVAIKTFA